MRRALPPGSKVRHFPRHAVFPILQDASLSTFCYYICVAKLYLRNNNMFTFLVSKASEVAADKTCISCISATLACFVQRRGGRAAGQGCRQPHQQPHSYYPLHAQSFYQFGKNAMSAYGDLQDLVNRQNAMDCTQPDTFEEFLKFSLQNTTTGMSQALTVLHQYLNSMHMLSYDENDKRRRWKRQNEVKNERALEMAKNRFFPGPKNLWASVVKISPSVNRRYSLNWCWPVDIVYLDIEESQDCRRGSIVRHAQDCRPLLSVHRAILCSLLALRRFLCQSLEPGLPVRE